MSTSCVRKSLQVHVSHAARLCRQRHNFQKNLCIMFKLYTLQVFSISLGELLRETSLTKVSALQNTFRPHSVKYFTPAHLNFEKNSTLNQYKPGLEYKLTSVVTLRDLLADLLGDAVTFNLVADREGEAGIVNDTGGDTKVDLGDSRLPLPDLSGRATQHYSIKKIQMIE